MKRCAEKKVKKMAKQDGMGMLRGKIGGMNFFSRNGKHFVGAETGVDRKRFKNDPAFQRSRENNEEFKLAAAWNKSIRRALKIKAFGVQTPGNVAKMQGKIYANIRTDETNDRGERQLQPQNLAQQLQDFEFTKDVAFGNAFTEAITATPNVSGNHIFTIDEHDSGAHVIAPINATHYQFTAIAIYSDPRPNNPFFFNGSRSRSTELEIDNGLVSSFNIQINDPNSVNGDFMLFWIGLEFLEAANGAYLSMKTEKSDVIRFLSFSSL